MHYSREEKQILYSFYSSEEEHKISIADLIRYYVSYGKGGIRSQSTLRSLTNHLVEWTQKITYNLQFEIMLSDATCCSTE